MPEFVYGLTRDEDYEPGVEKIGKTLIKLPDGSEFEGQWSDRKRHGRGTQIWRDGSIYEGYWKNDMANGRG